MEHKLNYTVWYTEHVDGGKQFFLLPENGTLLPGKHCITDLDDRMLNVASEELEQYAVTEEAAMQHLRKHYNAALEQTKRSFTLMNRLAVVSGKADVTYYENLASHAMGSEDEELQKPFTISKEIMQDLMTSIARPGASEEEQQKAFQRTFGRVPEVLKYFDEHNLALAAQNPDAWAQQMHDKLFGEQEAAKQQSNAERLKKEVQESIARGLRSAGVEPIFPEGEQSGTSE